MSKRREVLTVVKAVMADLERLSAMDMDGGTYVREVLNVVKRIDGDLGGWKEIVKDGTWIPLEAFRLVHGAGGEPTFGLAFAVRERRRKSETIWAAARKLFVAFGVPVPVWADDVALSGTTPIYALETGETGEYFLIPAKNFDEAWEKRFAIDDAVGIPVEDGESWPTIVPGQCPDVDEQVDAFAASALMGIDIGVTEKCLSDVALLTCEEQRTYDSMKSALGFSGVRNCEPDDTPLFWRIGNEAEFGKTKAFVVVLPSDRDGNIRAASAFLGNENAVLAVVSLEGPVSRMMRAVSGPSFEMVQAVVRAIDDGDGVPDCDAQDMVAFVDKVAKDNPSFTALDKPEGTYPISLPARGDIPELTCDIPASQAMTDNLAENYADRIVRIFEAVRETDTIPESGQLAVMTGVRPERQDGKFVFEVKVAEEKSQSNVSPGETIKVFGLKAV